ncbi:MAG: hypothetical protein J5793_00475, partial [Clostridia bacterium]|nr:hypothetical protein [Clostridia bacterium]
MKCVVNDVAAGKITDNGRRFSIYGTVSNIVSSDSEYVLALETALAAAVQFIVVDKESDAKACIRYLKENRLGRATFLPVESVSGRIADVSAVKDMPGYIGVASSLAKYDKKFEGVVNDLLGRTVIADNIENASAIARKTGFRVKTVTLDGQVINPGGSYTGGSSAGKVGIFTRARDIERLAGEIKKCREKTDSLVKELETVEEKIKETASLRAKAVEELNAKTAECAGLSDKIRAFEVRIDEENTHISSLADPREIIAGLEAAMSSLREELAKIDEAIASANAACASAKESLDGAKLREEAALQEVTAARMELYSRKNELSLAGERLASGSERENAIKARIKLYEDSSAKAEQTIAERIAETALLAAESSECDSEIAQFTERLASLMAGREEKEKELNEMRARQKKASAARDEAFRRFTADESKRNSVNASYDNVTSKLWEEYELTYSDAEKYRLPKEQMDKAPSRLASIKSKIKAMGTINVNAVEEYRVTKERYDFLTAQTDDLNKTRQQLDRTIDKLAVSMKTTFLEYFDKINIEFNAVFNELFGGGSARAELTDPEDPLGCGIEIILKVPGKSVRNISLLSGGEQSFAAISLYLALQRVNPAPFCVFDEI